LSVRLATVLRWHRQLVKGRWTYAHKPPRRPALDRRLQALVVRLARENPFWRYKRIVGELQSLGVSLSATSVRTILISHGLPPAPQRDELSWRDFLLWGAKNPGSGCKIRLIRDVNGVLAPHRPAALRIGSYAGNRAARSRLVSSCCGELLQPPRL
jgi:transposase